MSVPSLATAGARLRVGPLPSLADLGALQANGFRHLVNVSSVDLGAIYPRELWSCFAINQFAFGDIFSAGPATVPAEPASNHYLDVSTEIERAEFLAATRTLSAHLRAGRHCYVFCHRGRGRSPAVAAAAFSLVFDQSAADAAAAVMQLQPNAQFSRTSFCAISWAAARATLEEGA